MNKNRVFITGRSALTSSGACAQDTWNAIVSGVCSIAEIKNDDLTGWPCRFGGELKNFQPAALLPDRKLMKVISRHDALGIGCAIQAIKDSGMIAYRDLLPNGDEFNEQTGVYVGSPGNKYYQQYDFLPLLAQSKGDLKIFATQLFDEVHPMWLLRILPNNVLAYTGMTYGFKGPNHNFTNHAVGGSQALIEAYQAITTGQAQRAVVVGYDVGTEPQALFYYEKLGVLSKQHLKPFDAAHDGTILAEGAAALVLESEESVRARKAHCFAEVLGGLASSEAQGLFSIDSQGTPLADLLKKTLNQVQVKLSDVGLIVAHGNGNDASDSSEAHAFKHAFDSKVPPVTAFKWSMGHTLTASGLLDMVMSTYALEHGYAPGIANLQNPAPCAQGLPLSAAHQPINTPHALIVNRGFASMNSCMMIKACE